MTRTGAVACCLAVLLCWAALILPAGQPLLAQEKAQEPGQAPTEKAKPMVVPESEKAKKNPVPSTPEAIESGKSLYGSQCAMCHGAKGDGKGELTPRLKMTVPDLTNPQLQKKRTDGEWFYILSKGHADMPPENRLDASAKWEMITYIRTLSRGGQGGK
jgi:mono/diheme cytochrome c family protein